MEGGGYTLTSLGYSTKNQEWIPVVIGAGGKITKVGETYYEGEDGGSTSFGSLVAAGGKAPTSLNGANGGSGGGAWGYDAKQPGSGGSNGSNGGTNVSNCKGGTGQGTTTICPFNNVMYAGGGAGGGHHAGKTAEGGEGGGGDLGCDGEPNTGGGGGGAWQGSGDMIPPGSGGSGIVILRYKALV